MTAAITTPRPTEALQRVMHDVLGGVDVPEYVNAVWIARVFGLDQTTVRNAIAVGKLPAFRARVNGRMSRYAIRPGDALLIWGWKLFAAPSTVSDQT